MPQDHAQGVSAYQDVIREEEEKARRAAQKGKKKTSKKKANKQQPKQENKPNVQRAGRSNAVRNTILIAGQGGGKYLIARTLSNADWNTILIAGGQIVVGLIVIVVLFLQCGGCSSQHPDTKKQEPSKQRASPKATP
jgi:hypothetical protein